MKYDIFQMRPCANFNVQTLFVDIVIKFNNKTVHEKCDSNYV